MPYLIISLIPSFIFSFFLNESYNLKSLNTYWCDPVSDSSELTAGSTQANVSSGGVGDSFEADAVIERLSARLAVFVYFHNRII